MCKISTAVGTILLFSYIFISLKRCFHQSHQTEHPIELIEFKIERCSLSAQSGDGEMMMSLKKMSFGRSTVLSSVMSDVKGSAQLSFNSVKFPVNTMVL